MKKVAIIGGGVAGLSAGIYGQLRGYDCTVIEKNHTAGGNLTGWERHGCKIDNCMHWLTGTKEGSEYNRMWRDLGVLGEGIEMSRRDPFYYSEYGGKRLGLWRDTGRTLRDMKAVSPVDTKESERFIRTVESLIAAKDEKDAVKRNGAYAAAYIGYGRITLSELAKRFTSESLRCLMTDYLGGELAAITLIWAYAVFASGDGDVPAGGSRATAARMEERFRSLGGRLMTSTEAERIMYRGRQAYGVLLPKKRLLTADAVICCCDPRVTFGRLLPKSAMPKMLGYAYERGGELFSSIHAAFICRDGATLPKGITAFGIKPVKLDGKEKDRMVVMPYREGFAPDGKVVLQVMFFLHEETARLWIRASGNREKYSAAKERFAAAVASRLKERYPEVADSLSLLDVWTPATYSQFLSSYEGSYLSFAATPNGMIYRAPSRIHGFDNVCLATQWQSSPGGLPVAAAAGMKAVNRLRL